jgi:beta-1,4-mannosyl-glycoprotein beta-1,4-N-acetylglucosaminyltransferase
MKLFDCFTFLNELELLDLRLMTLNEIVDTFIIVEANKTHTGKEKEFIFEKNKDLFSDYMNKIIYIKVKDLPNYSLGNIWEAENHQRNCISRGLEGQIKDGDKIMVSDLDEIPNPTTISENLIFDNDLIAMEHKLFYYYVNCAQRQLWRGTSLTSYNSNVEPQHLRHCARGFIGCVYEGGDIIIKPNGGWHYSFMGNPEQVRYKVENIAESAQIINKVGNVGTIKEKMNTQADLWNRTDPAYQKSIVDITKDGMAPKCMESFIKKYPHFYFGGLE